MSRADFFVRRKKRKKKKTKTAPSTSGSGPSFFFLFFLPENSLTRSFGGPVLSQPETADTNELSEWPLSMC
jgi:hypothetical protein